jgi:isoleucyl-tRNA synthetase
MTACHPFYDRESVLLCGEHVTAEAGTGCVHTAPGHGADDYNICRQYDDKGITKIGTVVPVDSKGVMTEEAGQFAGLFYSKANEAIYEELKNSGALLAQKHRQHIPTAGAAKPHNYRATAVVLLR